MGKALLRTYGCQMNERDSENIAAMFAERGWELTDDEDAADIIVINTCSVREQAEQKAIGKLWHLVSRRRWRGTFLPVIGVTGCMAQNRGAKISDEVPGVDFILGARKTHLVADTAIGIYDKRISSPSAPALYSRKKPTPQELKKLSESAYIDISDDLSSHLHINKHFINYKDGGMSAKVSAFVSIMQGCQMNCSYCIVPKVRGLQRSRPADDIVSEVKILADQGVKEVTLLGQVVNAFGREVPRRGGISEFVRLLQRINDIDGIERIRFTSPHPSYFGDDLISAYSSLEKLCNYVHLPLQSGSDGILKKMNRPYRAGKFLEIVDKLRAQSPSMSISTDIIVGYPTETMDDFLQTRSLFQRAAFDMAFIFKYSPRQGTVSAQLPDDVSETEKEERNQILLADLAKQSLEFNEKFIGNSEDVLIEGFAKRGENVIMGRTRNHRKVVFEAPPALIGSTRKVKIVSATVTTLEGVLQPGSD